ncbi:MAG: hypothetical protein BGO51_02740 [Rhodospirillales bacterium 69-11]|nr:hypothetical protein [Rhodospirillales bacterium]OJW24411.1 MAG: hypothetical protein BGO51_02740 [Rhodospirillales bacterium 69-11]
MMQRSLSLVRKVRDLPRELFASFGDVLAALERGRQETKEDLRTAVDDVTRNMEHSLERQSGVILHGMTNFAAPIPDLMDGVLRHLQDLRAHSSAEAFERVSAQIAEFSAVATRLTETSAAMQQDLARQKAEISEHHAALAAQMSEMMRLQREARRMMPSDPWGIETADRVRRVLAQLRPFRLDDPGKIRLGRPHDGGYVMVDDIASNDCAISLGIDGDVSWDLEIAQRGLTVHQFDHTVEAPPTAHPNFVFQKRRVAPDDGADRMSIDTMIGERTASGADRIILKIDIEGDEWACLEAVKASALAHCTQMICEFHHLNRLADPDFANAAYRVFARLAEEFFVCHVHANNCGDLCNVGNTCFPDTLEVTFANRRNYTPVDAVEIFPTPIDMPNQQGRADIFLGAFRFSP